MNTKELKRNFKIWAGAAALIVIVTVVLASISEAATPATPLDPLVSASASGPTLYFDRTDTQIIIGTGGGVAALAGAIKLAKVNPEAIPIAVTAAMAQDAINKVVDHLTNDRGKCFDVSAGWWWFSLTPGVYDCDNPPANTAPLIPSAPAPSPTPRATAAPTAPPPPAAASIPAGQPVTPPDTVDYQTAPPPSSAASDVNSPANCPNPAICGPAAQMQPSDNGPTPGYGGTDAGVSNPAPTEATGTTSGPGDPGGFPPTTMPPVPPG